MVEVRGAPLQLWERTARHLQELMREFSLLVIGVSAGGHAVPRRLLDLVSELQLRFAGISEEPELARQTAMAAGRTTLDLTYRAPVEAAAACSQLLELLDEADIYCEQGKLMTLASTADQRAFRSWYLGEFIRQLQGEPPMPWPGPLD